MITSELIVSVNGVSLSTRDVEQLLHQLLQAGKLVINRKTGDVDDVVKVDELYVDDSNRLTVCCHMD